MLSANRRYLAGDVDKVRHVDDVKVEELNKKEEQEKKTHQNKRIIRQNILQSLSFFLLFCYTSCIVNHVHSGLTGSKPARTEH